ncbi:MAG: ABC transporter permease [Myxococcota bacterium]
MRDLVLPARPSPFRRTGAWTLVGNQLLQSLTTYARTPVASVVILVLPLIFLVVNGLVSQQATASPGALARLAASSAVFATGMAAFVMLAHGMALACERGVLKRLRGTPLPVWAHLAGRAGGAAVASLVGTSLMVAVAAAAYGLEVPPASIPAALAVLVLGTACLAVLGFAVAVLLPGSQTVLSVSMGGLVLVGFVSELFAFGAELPWALGLAGKILPLRAFVMSLSGTLGADGTGALSSHLVVLAAWTLAAAVIAVRRFDTEPRSRRSATGTRGATGAWTYGTSSVPGMIWGQMRHANRSLWREPVAAFFALAFPTLFVVILPLVTGNQVIEGIPFAWYMTTSMPVFGVALTAYVTLSVSVSWARDQGLLERLRGTPLPAAAFLCGRIASVFWICLLTVGVVLVAGWVVHGVAVPLHALPGLILFVVAGTACLAALGMAVSSLVPDADTVPAVALASFLPLVFVSDVFPLGDALPAPVAAAAWAFPLKHMVHGVREAFSSGTIGAVHLGVLLSWAAAGTAVALLRFRWVRGAS